MAVGLHDLIRVSLLLQAVDLLCVCDSENVHQEYKEECMFSLGAA